MMVGSDRALAWLGFLGLLCGCSGAPQAPPRQSVSPSAAAKAAIAQYDTSGDGKLDAEELEQSPPLAAMLATVKQHDPSHGDYLTADDIAGRIKSWLRADAIVAGGSVVVLLDGKPLAGATVTLEPEPWLGPSYRTSSGTTGVSGYATMSRTLEAYPGIYYGLYRVRISKKVDGRETVPEQYNDKTELGREVADDVPDAEQVLNFKLHSK
jgi:hypothetical protein